VITVCSGFPPSWPADYRERFLTAWAAHWPSAINLVADDLSQGGDLDRHRLIMPAAVAADLANGDLLAWLDPNVETISAVPSFVIPNLLKDADLCFIGRTDGADDLGFWAVRLSAPVRHFLIELADSAASGQPASEAWAEARALVTLKERDLTPNEGGDIWPIGPLGRYSRRMPAPAAG
jgi:hypothetical protein